MNEELDDFPGWASSGFPQVVARDFDGDRKCDIALVGSAPRDPRAISHRLRTRSHARERAATQRERLREIALTASNSATAG